jgi:hypothetical protein
VHFVPKIGCAAAQLTGPAGYRSIGGRFADDFMKTCSFSPRIAAGSTK